MRGFLSAASPPVSAGIGLGILIAALFAMSAYSRIQGRPGEADNRGFRLGYMALFCGPMLGLMIACLGYIHMERKPPDLGSFIARAVVFGGFLGLLGAEIFWVTSLLSRWVTARVTSSRPHPPERSPGEIWDQEMDGGT